MDWETSSVCDLPDRLDRSSDTVRPGLKAADSAKSVTRSAVLYVVPEAASYISPSAAPAFATRIMVSTTSNGYVKSRACSPLPSTVKRCGFFRDLSSRSCTTCWRWSGPQTEKNREEAARNPIEPAIHGHVPLRCEFAHSIWRHRHSKIGLAYRKLLRFTVCRR